jgi:hypothetical protein
MGVAVSTIFQMSYLNTLERIGATVMTERQCFSMDIIALVGVEHIKHFHSQNSVLSPHFLKTYLFLPKEKEHHFMEKCAALLVSKKAMPFLTWVGAGGIDFLHANRVFGAIENVYRGIGCVLLARFLAPLGAYINLSRTDSEFFFTPHFKSYIVQN